MPDTPEQTNANQQQAQSGSSTARTASGSMPSGKMLGGATRQFLIATRRMDGIGFQPIGLQPSPLDYVEQILRSVPDVEIVDRIGPRGLTGTLIDGMGGAPNVLVARMPDDKAAMLVQQSRGQLIVEPDQLLNLSQSAAQPAMVTGAATGSAAAQAWTIAVVGKDNAPLRDAEVYLFGSLMPVYGITDERGYVTLSLRGETNQSVRGLYVKPKSDYWTYYQAQPALDPNQPNLISLRPLADTFPEFPRKETLSWGQKAMRLDQLPSQYRGQNVKIGLLDSGIATSHTDLREVRFGFDFINKKRDSTTWNQDLFSHGSHCAGIIAGAENGTGIRGFAPDAEIHACRLFPGGHVSQLIDALEYCIEKQIDVVNLSLGGIEPSEALEQQILRAKRLGVACIVAAGNTGGPLAYPASSPNVLTVAAIGKAGEFPPDSYHMQCATRVDPNGLFSPKFTCFGPGVSVCAPGVAIVSSVPPNNYAVADGTSVAAAHITGLAALVLAHHPDFQGPFRARNSDRVDRLFQIIRSSAQPVNLGDPRRTGFGLPDVLAALGLVAWPATMMAGAGIPLATRIFGPFVPFGTNSAILYGALGAYSPVQGVPPVPVGVW